MHKIIYWLETHTMHPLSWLYVIIRSIQYKYFAQKISEKDITTIEEEK